MSEDLNARLQRIKGQQAKPTEAPNIKEEPKPADNTTEKGNATEGRVMSQKEVKGSKGKAHTVSYENIGGVDVKADKTDAYYGNNPSEATKAMYASTAEEIGKDETPNADEQLQKDTTNDYIQSLLNIGEEKAQALQNKAKEKPKMNQRFDASKDSNLGRYNYRIQHGFHIPAMDRDWIEYAQLETQARPSIQRANAMKDARAQAMSDRVAEMARKRDLDAWKTFNKRVTEGGFNDLAGRQFDEARASQAGADIIADYVKNGGNVIDGRVVGLPDYGGNHAGYKAISKEAGQYSTDAMTMDSYLQELKKDLASGAYGTGAMKGKYDAEINQIQRVLSGAGVNQADAEKQRIQYLYLPEEMQDEFQAYFKMYMSQLANYARVTGGDKAYQNVNSRAQRLFAGAKAFLRGENPQTKGQGFLNFANAISNLEGGLVDAGVSLDSIKEAWKQFEENLNRIAVIDPRVMYTQLALAKKLSVDKYNNIVRERGGIPLAKNKTAGEAGMAYGNFKVPHFGTGEDDVGAPYNVNLVDRKPVPDVGSNYNNRGTGNYSKKK